MAAVDVPVQVDAPYLWVEEFHQRFGLPVEEEPMMPRLDRANLRLGLLREELAEVEAALRLFYTGRRNAKDSVASLAQELADLLYVTYGMALECGIPITAVMREVHRANMSKLDDNGQPQYREDGKVVKGPNYRPPNIAAVLWRG